jgi:hypothetical protein
MTPSLRLNPSAIFNLDLSNSRNQLGREVGRVADQQVMAPDRLARVYLLLSQKNLVDSLPGIHVEQFTVLGKNQTAANAFKEADAKSILEALKLLSDTGSRQSKLICCVIDVVSCRDSHKCNEIVEFHFWAKHLIHLKPNLASFFRHINCQSESRGISILLQQRADYLQRTSEILQ